MTRWMLGLTTAVALASASSWPADPSTAGVPTFAIEAPAGWLAEDPADSLYRMAREALNRNEYRRAVELFAQITRRYPRSEYAADALYWEAFALYREGRSEDLRTALNRLDDQKRRYPRASTAGDAEALAARIRGALARQGDATAAEAVVAAAEAATVSSSGGNVSSATSTGRGTGGRAGGREGRGRGAGNDCDEDSDVKLAALNAVLQMDAERAMPLLTRVLARRDSGSVCLRRKAVFLVAQKKTDSTEAVLLSTVRQDPDPEVREQAVFWLSQVATARSVAMLDSIVRNSNDERLQERAIFALSQHGDARAADALRAVAERRDAPLGAREKAIFWLGQNAGGPAYLRSLFPKLDNDELREKAVFSIAQSGRAEDKRWLLDLAKDGRTPIELRKRALFWAGQSASAADLDALYRSLTDRELKEQIIFGYAQSKDPAAVDRLVAIAKTDQDTELRKRALFWLGQSKDPRVADVIEQMLEE